MDYVVGIIVFALIIGGAFWLVRRSTAKRVADSWNGVVTKKWVATYSDEDGEETKMPTIKVEIEGGKTKKLTIPTDLYDTLSEGDKLVKKAGEKDPYKA